ncbi:MAG TPA: adenosine deaminase [Streptosporangiaceae bacterium]|nr:adenosine deaminase [Streptosporangiaceae bacterium]
MLTPELLRRLPKAELHVHLDGSLRPTTLIDLARARGVELPARDPDALRRQMLVSRARNLEEYLERFAVTVAVLQTPGAIERVAFEMVADAAEDGVRYLEVRFCPALACQEGLSLRQVIEAELRGLARGEREFGVRTGVINCALRHLSPELAVDIARESVACRDEGVVGFDLAGAEAGHPPGPFGPAFDLAAAGGLGITVHAGEAAGPAFIAEAIHRCHARRIGHGTRLREDPGLEVYVRDQRILIEANITSNLQTRVVDRAAHHPVRGYFDRGLAVTLSTDNWLMSGVRLSDEYGLAHRELGFTRAEIDVLILNGFAGAFLSWPDKQALIAEVRAELAALR